VTSLEPERFVVSETVSVSSALGLTHMSTKALPACPGLRLTTSKAGMAKPPQSSTNGRPRPVLSAPARRVFSPAVKRVLFTFDPN
jgi:hypothetical protein